MLSAVQTKRICCCWTIPHFNIENFPAALCGIFKGDVNTDFTSPTIPYYYPLPFSIMK